MAPSNSALLADLFRTGGVRVRQSDFFSQVPAPMPPTFNFDRIEGMMLGLAIGDALGTEGISLTKRRRGTPIRDYTTPDGRGYPTDDSQLAFWTLEQMIEDGGFVPERVLDRFLRDIIMGKGMTVTQVLENRRAGTPWYRCGLRSAGNGGLMRIAPILLPHLRSPSPDLWADAALCSMITHNDSASISTCVAFVTMLWALLRMDAVPEPEWWLDSMVAVMRELECDESYRTRGRLRPPYQGFLWGLLDGDVRNAYKTGMPTADACDRWMSTAYLFETLPCVMYILMRHAQDPEDAILQAVNETWDNDTTAAIVGAAVGALHGRRALPKRWLDNLSGCTAEDDDGRMFELLEQARRLWA